VGSSPLAPLVGAAPLVHEDCRPLTDVDDMKFHFSRLGRQPSVIPSQPSCLIWIRLYRKGKERSIFI